MAERLTDLQAAYLRAVRDEPQAAHHIAEDFGEPSVVVGSTLWRFSARGLIRQVGGFGGASLWEITPAGLEALLAWEEGR